ncbi:Protein of unknown function, partial [Gryllus bimaculatus]
KPVAIAFDCSCTQTFYPSLQKTSVLCALDKRDMATRTAVFTVFAYVLYVMVSIIFYFIFQLESLGTMSGKPTKKVIITNYGQLS